jgi:hypothetical protein
VGDVENPFGTDGLGRHGRGQKGKDDDEPEHRFMVPPLRE